MAASGSTSTGNRKNHTQRCTLRRPFFVAHTSIERACMRVCVSVSAYTTYIFDFDRLFNHCRIFHRPCVAMARRMVVCSAEKRSILHVYRYSCCCCCSRHHPLAHSAPPFVYIFHHAYTTWKAAAAPHTVCILYSTWFFYVYQKYYVFLERIFRVCVGLCVSMMRVRVWTRERYRVRERESVYVCFCVLLVGWLLWLGRISIKKHTSTYTPTRRWVAPILCVIFR